MWLYVAVWMYIYIHTFVLCSCVHTYGHIIYMYTTIHGSKCICMCNIWLGLCRCDSASCGLAQDIHASD